MATKPTAKAKPGQIPFYTTITPVNEKFKDAAGGDQEYDLPLVTLPAGTVLFRGVKIPTSYEDIRYFYRDFLGNPEANGTMCMSPTHNVFFYPFPHIPFGTHTIGQSFNMMELVVLVHPVNVVCAMSPSSWVRGQGQRYSGTAPWQRCNSFEGPEFDCHLDLRAAEAKAYDNCLLPEYQVRSGTRGWMAIADLDSINPKKKRWGSDKPIPMKESTMGSYIHSLYARKVNHVEDATDLLLKAYRDDHLHAGFPEIALYPYKKHQGRKLITRPCQEHNDAVKLIESEAKADNLNYLPLALITADGVVDMVNGYFNFKRLGIESGNIGRHTAMYAREPIENYTRQYLDELQTKGITLPFYGKSKLSFDSRTGFYIFPTIVPSNLKIKIPEPILYKNLNISTPSNADKKTYEYELYRNFCMPLATEEDKRRVRIYEIMFRSFLPDHFLEKYGLEPGYGRRRAFIFERYPYLDPLFKELDMTFPKELSAALGRAGALYRKETGKKKKEKPQPVPASNATGAAAAAAVAANLTPKTPAYYPASPAYGEEGHTPEFGGEEGGHTPAYGPATPQYNATGEGAHILAYGGVTPPYNAGVPNVEMAEPPAPPLSGSRGGSRGKTRSSKGKKARRQTRKSTATPINLSVRADFVSHMWKAHGAVKQRLNA